MAPIGVFQRVIEKRIINRVSSYTLLGPERLHSLYVLAQLVEKESIPGDIVECGVCNGGSSAILSRFASRSRLNRQIWLFDSFRGMPAVSRHDGQGADGDSAESHVGKEIGDPQKVLEILRRTGSRMDRVRLVPGWFHETFPATRIEKIAFLNIDADWYESVKLCLNTFYDRVVLGGFISIDDYGHWPGCKKAVDEFFDERSLRFRLNAPDYTARWFRKE